MPHTYLLAASQVTHHWHPGTHMASLGFLWIGFVNVAMLVAFLGAASRREHPNSTRVPRSCREPADRPFRPDASGEAVLVSDRDRDRAADIICDAVAEGRLSFEEGSTRVGRALASRTRGDILGVLQGLPCPEAVESRRRAVSAGAVTAILAVTAAALVQVFAGAWVAWPVAVAVLLPMALRRSGDASTGGAPERSAAGRPLPAGSGSGQPLCSLWRRGRSRA